jgi:hypothetical protein
VAGAAVPQFLDAAYQGTPLEDAPSMLVALDPAGTILWMNEAWRKRARAYGEPDILERFGPGSSYFEGISEPLRSFYGSVLQNARLTGEPFEHEYECSSAETFRINHLRVLPFGTEGFLLVHSGVVERPQAHEEAEAVERTYRNGDDLIVQCSNCRRVRRRESVVWDWVRAWAERSPPGTSHGICKPCIGYYWGARLRAPA